MSDQKTEKPTPKKLREARKKGQVSKSRDITQSLLFLAALGVLAGGGPIFVNAAKDILRDCFSPALLTGLLSDDEVTRRFGVTFARLMLYSTPFLAVVTVVAGGVEFFQVKGLFAPEAIQMKFDKLNFIKGLQNTFFKPKTYLELVKNLVKFALVLTLAYVVVRSSLRDIVMTARATPDVVGLIASSLMFKLLFRVGVLFLVIGAADFFLQNKLYIKELMMSKDEVKREYKEDEGDPHIRHSRKQLHQQILAQNMVRNVPRADVVIVNPTHLAIAVQYDESSMNAPQITAKGQDLTARRIVELAKKSGVPITRNVPLARSLFQVELGEEIPSDLYEAVAEVLTWVYQLAEEQEA